MLGKTAVCTMLVLVFATVATAQSADAPPLSVEEATLYAHHDTKDTKELFGWMNTLPADGDDTAMGPSSTCQQHTGQRTIDEQLLSVVGSNIDRTYTFNLTPAQTGDLLFENGSKALHGIHIGAGSCFGRVEVTSTLSAGKTKITQGKKTGIWFDNPSGVYPLASIESFVNLTSAPSDNLTWTINIKGRTGGSVFLGISKERGMTNITLPISGLGASLPTVYEDVFDQLEGHFEFDNATTQTYQYNLTTSGGNASFTVDGELTNGTLHVVISDGVMEEMNETFNGTFDGSANFTASSDDNFTVVFAFDKAQGMAMASLTVRSDGGNMTGNATTPTDNETANGSIQGEAEGGVPVPAAVAIAAPLLAVLAWRRRRT